MRCHGIAWRLGPAAEHRGIYRAARACGGKSAPRAHRYWESRPSVAIDAIPSVDCTDHLRPMSQPLLTDKATTGGTKLDQAALKLAALDLEVATQSLFVAGQQRHYAEPCRGSSRIHRRRPGGCGAAGRVAAIEPSLRRRQSRIIRFQHRAGPTARGLPTARATRWRPN